MTSEPWLDDLDELFKKHGIDYEGFFDELSMMFKRWASEADDRVVRDCLEGVAERLSEASLAYYASTK